MQWRGRAVACTGIRPLGPHVCFGQEQTTDPVITRAAREEGGMTLRSSGHQPEILLSRLRQNGPYKLLVGRAMAGQHAG